MLEIVTCIFSQFILYTPSIRKVGGRLIDNQNKLQSYVMCQTSLAFLPPVGWMILYDCYYFHYRCLWFLFIFNVVFSLNVTAFHSPSWCFQTAVLFSQHPSAQVPLPCCAGPSLKSVKSLDTRSFLAKQIWFILCSLMCTPTASDQTQHSWNIHCCVWRVC